MRGWAEVRTKWGAPTGALRVRFGRALVCAAAVLGSSVQLGAQEVSDTTGLWAPVVIRNVRLFDGESVRPNVDVVLADGVVAAIEDGGSADRPAGAIEIDGRGRTLLPGMIDSHTHTFYRPALKASVAFGVTAHMDMFTSAPLVTAMKAEQAEGGAADRADLYSSATLVTAAGGHGTQFGLPIPTLDDPADAGAFIQARLDEGADYIKLVLEDGSAFGLDRPTLDEARLRAGIAAAHDRGVLAVVHVGHQEHARMALEAGADGLVHVFSDRAAEPGFVELAVGSGAFIVPTLSVLNAVGGGSSGRDLISDPVVGDRLYRFQIATLEQGFPNREGAPHSMDHAVSAVRALHEAGVPILAGTDGPNPGTALGASMNSELRLLVEVGMSPVEALRAATSVPADAFRLDDRGRIEVGARADVFLVEGDPTQDIRAVAAVEAVWKEGRRWMLDGFIDAAKADRASGGAAAGEQGRRP